VPYLCALDEQFIIKRCTNKASFKIGFSAPSNLNGYGQNFTGIGAYVGRTQISSVKILAPWSKWQRKGGFCNGYNELVFLCNGTHRHKIRDKTSIGVNRFGPQTAILGCFDGFPCDRPTSQELHFSTYLSLPSVTGRANSVPIQNRFFCRTYRFGCTEATRTPKSYPNFDKGTLTIALRWQSYRIRHAFSFELLYIPSYRRSNGVPFLRKFFCTTYRFAATRLWSHPPHIFEDVRLIVTTVARRFSPLTANCDGFHCQTTRKIHYATACIFRQF